MPEKVLIFGKNAWPFTAAAREAYQNDGKDVEYYDVSSDSEKLDDMLKLSDGMRRVPIIVENGKVIIGFNGRAWGV
jgi:glutaredoxin